MTWTVVLYSLTNGEKIALVTDGINPLDDTKPVSPYTRPSVTVTCDDSIGNPVRWIISGDQICYERQSCVYDKATLRKLTNGCTVVGYNFT